METDKAIETVQFFIWSASTPLTGLGASIFVNSTLQSVPSSQKSTIPRQAIAAK